MENGKWKTENYIAFSKEEFSDLGGFAKQPRSFYIGIRRTCYYDSRWLVDQRGRPQEGAEPALPMLSVESFDPSYCPAPLCGLAVYWLPLLRSSPLEIPFP